MKRIVTRTLVALAALALFAAPLAAADPADPADPADSCVRVGWKSWGGSGTCIGCEAGKSLVLSNNHVFSEREHPQGGYFDDVYPVAAYVVTRDGRRHAATAVAGERTADVALVVVDAELPAAELAEAVPPVGSVVWRSGAGTGYQRLRVEQSQSRSWFPSGKFQARGVSGSGDSGAAYWHDGRVVALHCGTQWAGGPPRGTPVGAVRKVVRERAAALFPKLARRLGGAAKPPASKPSEPTTSEPPRAPKPAAPPVVIYRPAPSCAGGSCQPPRRGLLRRW